MKTARLDLYLIEKGLASTRTKAQDLIKNGSVWVNQKQITKAGFLISEIDMVEVRGQENPFVSRGGLKLQFALEKFSLKLEEKIALDIGLSTGGFSHCMLNHGVKKIYGIDVGTNQLSAQLQQDPRLVAMEQQDIRHLKLEQIESVDFFTVDVSFISLQHIFPFLPAFLKSDAEGVVLVKPQFEVGREKVGKGVIGDDSARESALFDVISCAKRNGFQVISRADSPILGGEGNKEILLHVRWLGSNF